MSLSRFTTQFISTTCTFLIPFWLSCTTGLPSLPAVGNVGVYTKFARAIPTFLSAAASSHFAFLRGQRRENLILTVLFVIIRISLIFGTMVPAVMIPCIAPFLLLASRSPGVGESTDRQRNKIRSICWWLVIGSTSIISQYVFPMALACSI
jgi:hypothetical protein